MICYMVPDSSDDVLIAQALGLVEQVTVLTLIEELLEQQTIPGCEKIFDYIESRKTKLTVVSLKLKHWSILREMNVNKACNYRA